MKTSKSIHIAIADDFSLIRFSLRTILTALPDINIQVEASNGAGLIDQLQKCTHLPHLLILDIGMPVMNGYEAVNYIKKRWPSIKLIIHSQYSGNFSVRYMLQKGVNAFLSKKDNYNEVVDAIYSVMENGYYYSDVAPKKLFEKLNDTNYHITDLSAQQKKLLHYLVNGYSNKDISGKMNISPSSVESYRKEICRKLEVKQRAELIHFALHNELICLE